MTTIVRRRGGAAGFAADLVGGGDLHGPVGLEADPMIGAPAP
jgi:hypothetical protein